MKKNGRREEVSRSHFSFSLDKLSQQRSSWEISNMKYNNNNIIINNNTHTTLSGLLFLSYFSFTTDWQKAYLCFRISQNCVFTPRLGRVWRLQSQGVYGMVSSVPGVALCPAPGPWPRCCCSHRSDGEQAVAQVAASPSCDLQLNSWHVSLNNKKEMGRTHRSLTKNLDASG